MKVTTVGGRTKHNDPKWPGTAGPSMPQAPKGLEDPTKRQAREDYAQQKIEEGQQGDRFQNWWGQYNGSYYDFVVWDWLTFEKKLTPQADFHWQVTVHDFPADFYFPAKDMIWNLRTRGAVILPQPINTPPSAITDVVQRSSGVNLVNIYAEDLNTNAKDTLEKAYSGTQVI